MEGQRGQADLERAPPEPHKRSHMTTMRRSPNAPVGVVSPSVSGASFVLCRALPTLPIRFNPAMPQRPRRQGGAASDRRGGLLDVEIDAEEQERPQDDGQQR
jgi:hypothetical protein